MPLRSELLQRRWATIDLPILPFLAPRVFTPWPRTSQRAQSGTSTAQASRSSTRGVGNVKDGHTRVSALPASSRRLSPAVLKDPSGNLEPLPAAKDSIYSAEGDNWMGYLKVEERMPTKVSHRSPVDRRPREISQRTSSLLSPQTSRRAKPTFSLAKPYTRSISAALDKHSDIKKSKNRPMTVLDKSLVKPREILDGTTSWSIMPINVFDGFRAPTESEVLRNILVESSAELRAWWDKMPLAWKRRKGSRYRPPVLTSSKTKWRNSVLDSIIQHSLDPSLSPNHGDVSHKLQPPEEDPVMPPPAFYQLSDNQPPAKPEQKKTRSCF